ncbi:MAG: hypothetical protein CME64_15845 [Halobacteriovoraceae bacterium]|nr:hypothetical protein [Halobacteriovoraceae bacterium]
MNKIKELLETLNPQMEELIPFINENIQKLKSNISESGSLYSTDQVVLITYPDQFQSEDRSYLQNLDKFLENEMEGEFSHVHILPFYPWTSDDGFSPINYHEVCKEYGEWSDVKSLNPGKMVDCVFNHLSSKSPLFLKALDGDKKYMDMFHFFDDETYKDKSFQENISKVVRPRTSPLLTPFKVGEKTMHVWTTFGPDQVDTNISNKDMVKYLLECFFLYIEKGAEFFRVDAVPFMWKELGTDCSHHEKTHAFVKLMRAIAQEINPKLLIITESNVPHQENITYWGNGSDEAHVVYNFSFAPLLLHGMTFGNNQLLNQWAKDVFKIPDECAFLNFTSTHDGIGLRGLEGIASEDDVLAMCSHAKERGGKIGMKTGANGEQKPYELNITWSSYLEDKELKEDELVRKIANSHALAMFLPGIGAHYVHNFFGTKNWQEGYEKSGIPRRLNRKKFSYPLDLSGHETSVMKRMLDLIRKKKSFEQFHPKASFEVVELNPGVFSFLRGESPVLVAFNLENKKNEIECKGKSFELAPYELLIQELS